MNKKKKIFKVKSYAHFDLRTKVKPFIYNPKEIKKHDFLPFVLNTQRFRRFNKEDGVKIKERDIMFSSHMDRYIYQLYNQKLNGKYNVFVKNNGINRCSVAYRNNLKGKSNINFAHEVFKYILNKDNCFILVGDYKHFFDNLDHKYLKKELCKLFNENNLPDDYYTIFKNITKYKYFDLEEICDLKGITPEDLYIRYKMKNEKTGKFETVYKLKKLLSFEEMEKYKTDYLHYNGNKGIPQGSAISSVLANIYMIDADIAINKLAIKNRGLYRRYSDDFVLIIPNVNEEKFSRILEELKNIILENGNPELQDEKTKIYKYNKNTLKNVNKIFLPDMDNTKDIMDFLGFSFDGDKIKIREKSMTKFYYRMYRKIESIARNQGITQYGNKISCKNLYRLYSIYGKSKGQGNFVTYNERCERVFSDLGEHFISYKYRFINKLKNRYNKKMKEYK